MLQRGVQSLQVAKAHRIAAALCLRRQMVLLLQPLHEVHWRELSLLQYATSHKARKKDDVKKRDVISGLRLAVQRRAGLSSICPTYIRFSIHLRGIIRLQ
jgi:hypothetical protein